MFLFFQTGDGHLHHHFAVEQLQLIFHIPQDFQEFRFIFPSCASAIEHGSPLVHFPQSIPEEVVVGRVLSSSFVLLIHIVAEQTEGLQELFENYLIPGRHEFLQRRNQCFHRIDDHVPSVDARPVHVVRIDLQQFVPADVCLFNLCDEVLHFVILKGVDTLSIAL